jgi:hypothetical protein
MVFFYLFTLSLSTTTSIYRPWLWLVRGQKIPTKEGLKFGFPSAGYAATSATLTTSAGIAIFIGTVITPYAALHGYLTYHMVAALTDGVGVVLWVAAKWVFVPQVATLSSDPVRVLFESNEITKSTRPAVVVRTFLA